MARTIFIIFKNPGPSFVPVPVLISSPGKKVVLVSDRLIETVDIVSAKNKAYCIVDGNVVFIQYTFH